MKCFVIMPFASEFDDVYSTIKTSVTTAVPGEKIDCARLDEFKNAGRISEDLLRELQQSAICIADLTNNVPNVMWEVGYVMALKKPLLLITQDISQLPFDIKDMRTIEYNRQSLARSLQPTLAQAFSDTLGAYEVSREITPLKPPKNLGFTIAITGSMKGDEASCIRRIESLLEPYIKDEVSWLCGSFGLVDELAVEFLAKRKQKMTIVGYHSYDISDRMLKNISQYQIPFIDAKKEQIPKGISSPSERDIFFLSKADVIILLWNGRSGGTKEMVEWYSRQQKDHVVGFF